MRSTLLLSFVFVAACTHQVTGPTGGADQNPPPAPSSTGSSQSPTVPVNAKRAFVTSTVFYGKLSAAVPGGAEDVKGGAAGDALCQQAADAAELGGAWQAYLSDADLDANTRLEGNGPWFSTKGTKLFNNKANLATKPLAPFNVDERGEAIEDPPGYDVHAVAWTGIGGGTCMSWSQSDDYAAGRVVVGIVGSAQQSWRAANASELGYSSSGWSCSRPAHLYCFEK